MSVFVQHVKTNKFLGGPLQWTDEPALATQFGGSSEALFFCCRNHLDDVRIVGSFADERQNFSIPLREHLFDD